MQGIPEDFYPSRNHSFPEMESSVTATFVHFEGCQMSYFVPTAGDSLPTLHNSLLNAQLHYVVEDAGPSPPHPMV